MSLNNLVSPNERPDVNKMKRGSINGVSTPLKKPKLEDDLSLYFGPNKIYYKHPISCGEANKFNNRTREKPITLLNDLKSAIETQNTTSRVFLHWFRSDLRLLDNTSLCKTWNEYVKWKEGKKEGRFITVFTINEHDWRAHLDGGWKLSFMLKALFSLRDALAKMAVPLYVLHYQPGTAQLSNSDNFAEWFKNECLGLAKESESVIVSANAEYESDELYRDIRILKKRDDSFNFQVHHDICVLEPCTLKTGKGSIYTIFTPWYKKWAVEIEAYLKKTDDAFIQKIDDIEDNSKDFEKIQINYELPEEFTSYIPSSTENHPEASEAAAIELLSSFLDQKVNSYDKKDILRDEGSSHLSCYLSLGLISSRYIVFQASKKSKQGIISKDIKKNNCLQEFVREVAWRDFYKNAICNWPYLSMDLPFKFEMDNLRWKREEETFRKWCSGTTGVPIVDAIMRKLLYTGYINNRARMIVASFLSKNLLLDWRWGERWFRRHLRDYDLSSNVGGWGFCSSTGIDAQPYFRIFNMELQSKRYDPNGDFIKRWVPELKSFSDVHNLAKTAEYHHPIVDLKQSREEALEAYRQVI